jgi:hypothetical protein
MRERFYKKLPRTGPLFHDLCLFVELDTHHQGPVMVSTRVAVTVFAKGGKPTTPAQFQMRTCMRERKKPFAWVLFAILVRTGDVSRSKRLVWEMLVSSMGG